MRTTRRRTRLAGNAAAAFLLLGLCLCGAGEARAQWTSGGGNTTTADKVGVGTTAPTAVVHAKGNLSSPLTGTVAVTQNSAAVTGTGTSFATELAVGDSVKIGSEVFTVSAIASATSMTLDSNYLGSSAPAVTAYRDPNLFAADNGDAASKFVISRSGRVGIGTSAPAMPLTIYDTGTTAYRGFAISQYSTDSNSALISLVKHRGTPSAPSVVASGDNVGSVLTNVYNGSGYLTTAGITFQVNGAVTASSIPTDLLFRTSASGAAEKMRLTSGGFLGLGTSAPAAKLDVRVTSLGAGSNTALWSPSGAADANTSYVHYGAGGDWYIRPGTSAGRVIMTDNGGTVGIGTGSPNAAYKLDVAGSVNASGLCLGADCRTSWSQVGGTQWANGAGSSISYGAGSVGVGTSAPVRGLHVAGPNGSGSAEFILENTGMPANYRKFNLWGASTLGAAGRFFFRLLNDAGTATARDFMAFDNATGNVGVGATAPSSLLEVRRDQATGTEVKVSNADAAGFAGVYLNGGFAQTAGGFLQWNNVTGNNNLFVATGGTAPLHLGTNNAVRMTLMPTTGYVGIGTSTPSQIFQVHGSNTFSGMRVTTAATGATINDGVNFGYDDAVGAYVWNREASSVIFATANAERVRVDGAGNVGIGTQSPGQKLDVAGNVNASGLCLAGDCKTAWSQVGGASSQWTTTGPNVYFDGGNVGVGTSSPASRLHVVGGARLEGANGRVYLGTTAPTGGRGLEIVEESATTFSIRHHDPNVAWRNLSLNPYAGNVGINAVNPIAPLTVGDASSTDSDGFIVMGKKTAGGTRQMRMGYDANFNFVIGDYGNNNVAGQWSGQLVVNWQAPANSLHVNSAGSVGVGTGTPNNSYKLDVAGAANVGGNLNVTGNITGANIQATYQDVAEWVPSVQKLAAGTVVVLDAARTNHVVASSGAYDTKAAGVVSAQPGVILGVAGEGKVMVATTGRVRVRVDATRGAIRVGDLLVTSGVEGLAMRSVPVDLGGTPIHRPGTIIGKALEPLASGTGEILVLLSLQ